MRAALVRVAASIVLTLVGAAAGAQTFTAGTGIVTYTIRADRTAAFEQLIERLLQGLRSPADLRPGVSIKVLRQASAAGAATVAYVLIADPAAADVDYSLGGLVSRTFEGAELADVRQQLAWVLQDATVAAIDLRALGAVNPLDRLRERIGLQLGDAVRAGAADATPDAALEALRGPAWVADRLTHQLRRSGTAWQADWSLTLRNASLARALDAEVVVELVDASGRVLAQSAPEWVAIATQESTGLSGTIDVREADGPRVAAARLRVTPR